MKKILVMGVLFGCFGLLVAGLPEARAEDAVVVFNQLKTELQNNGMNAQDVASIEKPVKEMLNRGATKEDLKKVLTDLSGKGVSGQDFKDSVDSMNELVKSGEVPKEAGNLVSRAAHQAKAQGLKGKELAAKVHEAVRQRKMAREQMRTEMKARAKEMQGKAKETEKDAQEKNKRQRQMMMEKSRSMQLQLQGARGDKGKR